MRCLYMGLLDTFTYSFTFFSGMAYSSIIRRALICLLPFKSKA